jgi:GT2 family glycosyltransferase
MLHLILPVHDRCKVTEGFVRALRAQTHTDYRLLLVDDGCTDGTADMARSLLPSRQLVVLRGNGHLWWGGSLQLAYEHLCAEGLDDRDAVLIMNDDVTFEPGFLSGGLAALAEAPQACIQAIGVDRTTGKVDRGAVADLVRLRFRDAAEGEAPNCLCTRGLLMYAGTFVRSGGFRPRWLPHYLSDYEFTLRLQRHGVPLRVDPRFTASVAFELTGLERPSRLGPRQFIAESFSNRAMFNPKHWSAFVVMTCPRSVIPLHLARIWLGFARGLLRSLLPIARKVAQ